MIQKPHKLTTKEVNYLLRRRQAIYVWWYKILHCDQYPNNTHHQTGVQVSGKIHKHAVQRNIIRRAYYAAREDLIDKAVHNHYHKIFVMIHPEHCEIINELIQGEKRRKEAKSQKKLKISSLFKAVEACWSPILINRSNNTLVLSLLLHYENSTTQHPNHLETGPEHMEETRSETTYTSGTWTRNTHITTRIPSWCSRGHKSDLVIIIYLLVCGSGGSICMISTIFITRPRVSHLHGICAIYGSR